MTDSPRSSDDFERMAKKEKIDNISAPSLSAETLQKCVDDMVERGYAFPAFNTAKHLKDSAVFEGDCFRYEHAEYPKDGITFHWDGFDKVTEEPREAILSDLRSLRQYGVEKPQKELHRELTMADLRRDCFPKSYTWWTEQPNDPPREDKFKDLLAEVMPEKSEAAARMDADAEAVAKYMDTPRFFTNQGTPPVFFDEGV